LPNIEEVLLRNLEDAFLYYSGWVMRLYFDMNEDPFVFNTFCNLSCQHDNLDLCDVRNLPGTPMVDAKKVFPMTWRFFPTLDPQVRK